MYIKIFTVDIHSDKDIYVLESQIQNWMDQIVNMDRRFVSLTQSLDDRRGRMIVTLMYKKVSDDDTCQPLKCLN